MRPSTATRVVVADAGPLIALGRLDLLWLLGRLFADVQVPRAVWAECVAKPASLDARRIGTAADAGVLTLCDATVVDAPGLDAGESAAIGRAIEIDAGLLTDDMAARQHAAALGVAVIGTVGVLVLAKRGALIDEVRPCIGRLRASGRWLSESVVEQALAAAGELTANDNGQGSDGRPRS